MNNLADRGGCYPPKVKAEVDNIPRYPHNSSHHSKAEFNNCFIIHSRVINKLTDCTSSQTFFNTLVYFSARYQDIKRCFFLHILLRKLITFIDQNTLRIFAFLPFSYEEMAGGMKPIRNGEIF